MLGYSPLQTGSALTPLAVPIMALGRDGASVPAQSRPPRRRGDRHEVVAAGLFSMCTLGTDSSYIGLVVPFLIASVGIGLRFAPTTSAIMGAVPNEKQGVASAVNDTTRELVAAVGIAVAGSVLAARHTDALAPGLAAFPEQVRGPSLDSLANALEVTMRMGPRARAWRSWHRVSFSA